MSPERSRQAALWTALGVSAGVVTGLWLWRRQQRTEPHVGAPEGWARPKGAGAEIAGRLRRDESLARRAIEVDAIADGVIELTGEVRSRSEAERAVAIAQEAQGIYTVVNRLTIAEEEAQREATRRRRENGDPDLQERQHYGMRVGMGTRRQSPDTDPDRPSDKQKILDRQLDVANVEDAPESGPDPISGAEAVESSDLKPGYEDAIRDAGLDPSPRPTSTPKESVREDGAEGGEASAEPVEEEER